MSPKLNYAIVFVSDMDRSVKFYRDVIGLPLKFQSPGWSEMANEGTPIALHLAKDAASPAAAERPGSCRLGFQVADLAAAHAQMIAANVTCLSPPAPAGYGLQQAVYTDPDGLAFTLTQPPGKRP